MLLVRKEQRELFPVKTFILIENTLEERVEMLNNKTDELFAELNTKERKQ